MLEPGIYAALTAVAVLTGFIDAIAGGGGLIMMPALLSAGLPPINALATNKLQSVFGTAVACSNYARKGLVDWRGHVDDMPSLMRSMDVIALPSYYREGVPKSLIEAAACGLAVITTNLPGCREVVSEHGISEQGAHDELIITGGVYSRLHQAQFGAPA